MGKRSPVPEFLSDDEWQEYKQLEKKKGSHDRRDIVAALESCSGDLGVFEDELKDPSRLSKKTRKEYESICKRLRKDLRELERDLAKAGPPVLNRFEYWRFDELNKRYWQALFAPEPPEVKARRERIEKVLKTVSTVLLAVGVLILIGCLGMLGLYGRMFNREARFAAESKEKIRTICPGCEADCPFPEGGGLFTAPKRVECYFFGKPPPPPMEGVTSILVEGPTLIAYRCDDVSCVEVKQFQIEETGTR